MTDKKICDCCHDRIATIKCHDCELFVCDSEDCFGGYDKDMNPVCVGCAPEQPYESDPEWKKQQIKNGLRQLGTSGLTRLKEWIEAGKAVTFGGNLMKDGAVSPFVAALPLTTIQNAKGDLKILQEAVELCFSPFDWEPPNYNWEMREQTSESLLAIVKEMLNEASND